MGGLATAIRLASNGFDLNVFEKNSYPGGKLTEFYKDGYRFDKGPSLFTLPELIDELTKLCNYKIPFNYTKLKTITNYFYEDGTTLSGFADQKLFAKELSEKLGESEERVFEYLKKSKFYYDTTADLFLNQSLHQIKNFINIKTLKGIVCAPFLGLNKTMNLQNESQFKNKKTVQLFNRYATYNGSDPYKAPALMNIVNHLEFGLGAYLPEKGMHQITEYLMELAKHVGVKFYFSHLVTEIVINKNQVNGLTANGIFYKSNSVVSDVDMNFLYHKLLPNAIKPKKLLEQEKSSSAYVLYWGIKKEFKELGLHNILFSDNYKEEFNFLFENTKPYHDPTIYINITSKYCKNDAPDGCENWFVMVNVPHNKNNKSIEYAAELRTHVINKINRILNTQIEKYIVVEEKLDPFDIETETSSFGGSLYGNASNNKFSAFLRHSNYSTKIKGLYLVGGSVHPGGGIPLCLLSGKITSKIIIERNTK